MRNAGLKLTLDDLSVDSFATYDAGLVTTDSHVIRTVADNTNWYSCGGTCGTCGGTDCYA